ncbi:MAG: mechanosensitive ion channel family protein [Myxococcales bacterium]|nr:mechanosensitive ion channel family protein [Myxococcales bacterium]
MDAIIDFLTGGQVANLLRALAILGGGILAARVAMAAFDRFVAPKVPNQRILLRRAVWYGLLFLIGASTLRQLGFNLSVLLGAAGILTVAIGFASQTSASNLISGIFLLTERPFTIGDIITVGTTTGEVISVDLISVKLRTPDNLLVRVPNEMLLKSQITNLSHYAIRRLDIALPIAFDGDVGKVKRILMALADKNALVLDEPAPMFMIKGFGAYAVEVQFSVWSSRLTFLEMRNSIQTEIQKAFADEGIRIPVPRYEVQGDVAAPPPPPA